MRALAWFGNEDVRMVECSIPDISEDKDVIIKVTARPFAAVTCTCTTRKCSVSKRVTSSVTSSCKPNLED